MSLFETLVDQDRPLEILRGLLARQTFPHAFLLTGPDGVGKRTAAKGFAMACNCLGRPVAAGDASSNQAAARATDFYDACGHCRSCRQIQAGTHPDVICLAPSGNIIKTERIRELTRRLLFRPQGANHRVIIISDAWTMNREAANALLKALEEPPPQTIFFLTAGQTADLLPTVASRCQNIRFNPVTPDHIARILQERYQLPVAEARSVALLTDGSVAGALELADRSGQGRSVAVHRQWLLAELTRLPQRPFPVVLAFAEKMAADKNRIGPSLEMIKSFLRDVLLAASAPEKIINTDLAVQVREAAAREHPAGLMDKITAVTEVEKALARQGNSRLWLEYLALRLAGAIN